jgi:hypothetical protein
MEQPVWPDRLSARTIIDAGFPDDLYEWSTGRPPGVEPFQEDPTFLLVAYGLSHLGVNVPPVANPEDVPPLDLSAAKGLPIDVDDYYPK